MNQPKFAFAQAKNPDRHSDYVCYALNKYSFHASLEKGDSHFRNYSNVSPLSISLIDFLIHLIQCTIAIIFLYRKCICVLPYVKLLCKSDLYICIDQP